MHVLANGGRGPPDEEMLVQPTMLKPPFSGSAAVTRPTSAHISGRFTGTIGWYGDLPGQKRR